MRLQIIRLLESAFASQKIESRHFYSCTPSKNFSAGSYHHTQIEENYSFPPESIFLKIISPPSRKGGNYALLKRHKSSGFLTFSWSIEMNFWPEMNQCQLWSYSAQLTISVEYRQSNVAFYIETSYFISGPYSEIVLGTPFFEMVIFPHQHRGCLRVRKLRVFKISDPLKLFCGVRTCIIYKTIIFNASKREGMIANLLLASIISTQWKLLSYFEWILVCLWQSFLLHNFVILQKEAFSDLRSVQRTF